jgi:hypothetical protein
MEIRDRETGDVITTDDLRKKYWNVSFPDRITTDILDDYGCDPILNGPQAKVSGPYEVSVRDGIEQIKGKWFTKFVVGPIFNTPEEEIEYKNRIDNDKSKTVRLTRNELLKECDWTQIPDCTVNKTVWAEYRQQLRDISNQEGFPHDVVWPEQPTSS